MKLYNAMEESYLKENLIHKWVTNIVRQNDGYEFLLDDEVYLPVYKYALKITKRKTVKLNLVEEKVLQIVSIGVHQVDEIAKILGITRPLLDVTLADLHVKDLISVSSDICSLLKKGEQALSNLERVEKQQDIMKDIYMDSFKGKILENITRYQVVEKGIIDDNKLEPLVQAEDMKVIVSRFEDIQEIFQDEYSATRIADGIRTETQELLTIDGIERVDARSYEERGIDKIPMVHEGPNVQAMEARGISTALGSLNRLIRALNDMKERAKNLLQWSLLRQSQLMERMLFLHQPTLADYLRNYYDKRNAVAESYAYGTQKAKNTNLKQFAETIRFLEEQDVRTPEQLTEKIQEFDTQLNEVSQRLKKQLAALQRVNVNLYAMKEYFETRPVYLELKNKYFGREKFKEEHKKELSGYYRSERILKENLDANGKIPEGKWKREADCLSEEIAALRKEDKRIHAMLRKYEKVKNHVEVLMAEEGEGVSLPETNKREQSTETKEAVRTMKPKKKHHGMEL